MIVRWFVSISTAGWDDVLGGLSIAARRKLRKNGHDLVREWDPLQNPRNIKVLQRGPLPVISRGP